jgi:hypothetical protein
MIGMSGESVPEACRCKGGLAFGVWRSAFDVWRSALVGEALSSVGLSFSSTWRGRNLQRGKDPGDVVGIEEEEEEEEEEEVRLRRTPNAKRRTPNVKR